MPSPFGSDHLGAIVGLMLHHVRERMNQKYDMNLVYFETSLYAVVNHQVNMMHETYFKNRVMIVILRTNVNL